MTKMIDAGVLQGFHEEFEVSRAGVADLNSHHGDIMKRLDSQGYHRAAFKLVAKLVRGDVTKAQDFMRAFDQYSEILGLNKHIGAQSDLLDEVAEERAAVA